VNRMIDNVYCLVKIIEKVERITAAVQGGPAKVKPTYIFAGNI